ncbi:4Fe-4S dicluster domain-containing protein [Desulfobacula sp.]|uniref:4Fe-4S dicluster domain-containing protein n=1 Tax=Desulfobacula sp. TaxID=2593537 RepID=UPI0025C56369|nr:4Fe-4S dicluster domain-containing protein [Desulfobacula sp.]MBC2705011.1 4Fe-4S dicluster domain-containing protein [Desulfobacula sp.]
MITLDNEQDAFADEIKTRSGINFSACLHCQSCANGCPFLEGMDYAPNAVLRLIQLGLEETALKCSTIWICVGCNTCSSYCPMAIDISAVMDELRHKAIEKGIKIAEPDVLNFHNEVLNTVKKYGRTHKLEIMMRYKLKKMDLFSDMGVGLKMLKKRKLDLTPSKVQDEKAIEKIFKGK